MQQFNRESTYHNNVINESRLNPRNFWNAIKEIFSTKAGTKNSNSKTPQSNKKLADSFANYFSTAVRKLKTQSLRLKGFVCKSPCSSVLHTNKTFRFGYVSKVFITNFLKKMKRNKSTGLYELPPRALKDYREYIATSLYHIINFSLQVVPSAWKQAKLVPIFKSGDQGKLENCRPISVLPVLSKLLEKAVHSQLIDYLENNKLLSESQFGYRERRSTQHATTLLVDEIRQSVDKRGNGRSFVSRSEQGI